ncbi:hypothetical protein ZIOFF_048334 [Zingiber officinale]|uniref:3-hydroxyisobutyrate dehydrogenase n=1 Tax=Zingiber officinale TaxID=94328 RepID=A0A8J5KS48_ZINOF|nr:hypothetical protein ZIOFF_048334 [Zingiber officinale]
MGMAKSVTFPLPLLSVAHQSSIHGYSATYIDDCSAGPWKMWEKTFGVDVSEAANKEPYNPEQIANKIVKKSKVVDKIGFVGLGAMGFGMAAHLLRSNFQVIAYDWNLIIETVQRIMDATSVARPVYKPTLSRFADLGGAIAGSPLEVSKDAEVLIVMVANESQAENVLYGNDGSVSVLPAGATIILSSTVSPGFLMDLEKRIRDSDNHQISYYACMHGGFDLYEIFAVLCLSLLFACCCIFLVAEDKGLNLVDAPVSGGVKRAADGTLTVKPSLCIMTSGTDEALLCAGSILSVLSEKLYVIKGGCGAASSVKMVNQLLAGVHIAAAAEAMAFSARLGLKTRELFELIQHTGGFSWVEDFDSFESSTSCFRARWMSKTNELGGVNEGVAKRATYNADSSSPQRIGLEILAGNLKLLDLDLLDILQAISESELARHASTHCLGLGCVRPKQEREPCCCGLGSRVAAEIVFNHQYCQFDELITMKKIQNQNMASI